MPLYFLFYRMNKKYKRYLVWKEMIAQYKETMRPYIIGAFLVFGVSNLIAIIASIAESI